jgi:hypothetical protein
MPSSPLPHELPVLYASRTLLGAIQASADSVPMSLWRKAIDLAKLGAKVVRLPQDEGVSIELIDLLHCNFVCVLLELHDHVDDAPSQVRTDLPFLLDTELTLASRRRPPSRGSLRLREMLSARTRKTSKQTSLTRRRKKTSTNWRSRPPSWCCHYLNPHDEYTFAGSFIFQRAVVHWSLRKCCCRA